MATVNEIQEILGDNQKLLQFHTRREARPGLWILSFDGALMPDSHPAEVQVKGQLNHAALIGACNEVREIYNARIGREEVATSQPSAPRDDGGSGDDRPARGPVRTEVPAPPTVSDIEGTLEAVIESQVSRLRDRITALESRIAGLGTERNDLLIELAAAERALGAYNDQEIPKPKPARRKRRSTKKPAAPEGQATADASEEN